MRKYRYTDTVHGLTKMVGYFKALAPQLPKGFRDDHHKTRNLCRAFMPIDWAQQPISQITTARYTFTNFITSLQEIRQLKEEMSQARAQEIKYCRYTTHPHYLRHPNNRRGVKDRAWLSRRYNGRYKSPGR